MVAFFTNIAGRPGSVSPTKKQKRQGLTSQDIMDLQFVGTAVPGTEQAARERDVSASARLSSRNKFSNIPAVGGFTILGKNAFGQDVARDNTTGQVRTVASFNPITPAARALGESKTPKALESSSNIRRRSRGRTGTGTTTGRRKNVVGTSSLLGVQSILG